MSIGGARVTPAMLEPVGRDLHRPECVVCDPSGDLVVSDWRGGVTRIRPDGSQETCLSSRTSLQLRPNGIAAEPRGRVLIAHLGDGGGVYRLHPDGSLDDVLLEIEGEPLPPTNFVARDPAGRIWISVSTRRRPRQRAWRPDVADGFIVRLDARGARIAADGLHYTNEIRTDPSGRWLYAVETFGRRLTRFALAADGGLGPAETVATFGYGCFPDGFAFDAEQGIWITSLVSNRLLRLDGARLETMLEEVNEPFVEAAERAFAGGRMTAEHLGPIPGTRLQHLTSVAVGGREGRLVHLGSLHGSCIYRFRTGVPDIRRERPGGA